MVKPAKFIGKPRLTSIQFMHDPAGQPIIQTGPEGSPKFTFELDYIDSMNIQRTAVQEAGPDNIQESGLALTAYTGLVEAWEGKV